MAHSLVHNSFSTSLIQKLIVALDKFGIPSDNEDFVRFKTCLLEYNQMQLVKKYKK